MSLWTWHCAQGHSHARTAKYFQQTVATVWIHPIGSTVFISCSIKRRPFNGPRPSSLLHQTLQSAVIMFSWHLQNPDLPNSESWWSVQLMLDYVNGDMKLARSCSAMKPDPLCVLMLLPETDSDSVWTDATDTRPFLQPRCFSIHWPLWLLRLLDASTLLAFSWPGEI